MRSNPRSRLRAGLAVGSAIPLLMMAVATSGGAVAADDAPDRTASGSDSALQPGPTAITTGGAMDLAAAMASSSASVTGASFVTQANPVSSGIGDSALTGFPTAGSTFAVLSTGEVASVDQPGTFASTGLGGGNVRGDTDNDVTILKVDLQVPAGSNCLSFDFRFLSEEFPRFVGTSFNDAFIAELDTSTWTTSGSAITAPDNFAFDTDGNVVSINSTGLGGMAPANGVGTAFDGGVPGGGDSDGAGTVRLAAATEVTPGAHSVYFSIFDQGDTSLDSAAFIDNLIVGYAPDPDVDCVPGAVVVTQDLDLAPDNGTAAVGSTHTVTATLTTDDGTPVANTPVEFTVSGAHSTTGSGTTDASGHATFSYTGTNVGHDTISGCARPEAGQPCSANDSVVFDWTGDAGKVVERIHGADRYGTAAAISSTWSPGIETVYLASGLNYPDAMPAGALGGTHDAPVLLTRTSTLPHDTKAELNRLAPQNIVLLGGNAAISDSLIPELQEYAQADTPDEVSRIAGPDRYATAAQAALTYPTGVEVAYIAKGTDFPDALAAAARGGALDSPVLLTRTDTLPASTKAALTYLGADRIVVLGGTASISDAVETELAAYTTGTVTRHAGVNRYDTAAMVSQDYAPGVNAVFVATGDIYADSMTGAPISVAIGGPIVLTKLDTLPDETITELERLDPERIIILGGTAVVSAQIQADLAAYFG